MALAVSLTALFLFGVHSAQAVTLIPPSLEFNLNPGKPYETIVKLFNEEERQLKLYTQVSSFSAKDESGVPKYDLSDATTSGLSSWIQVDKGPLTIDPGERIEVPIKINAPATAEPGGHYAVLFFSENPPEEAQITIGTKLGVLLLARVSGEVVEVGSIKQFAVDSNGLITRLPVNFFVRFENSGNVHLRPTGTISISNMFKKNVAEIEVNQKKSAALPNAIRRYDASWDGSDTSAIDSAGTSFWSAFQNERKHFAFGKYTAHLSLVAGQENSMNKTATVAFWVFPWHVITVYGIVLIIIILALWFLIKQYNSWLINKTLQAKESAKSEGEPKQQQPPKQDKQTQKQTDKDQQQEEKK
jgi:hypothetical protein